MAQPTVDQLRPTSGTERCPACGEPLAALTDDRCPLCAFEFAPLSTTAEDHTPFAASSTRDLSAWLGMCRWIYGAGGTRVAHLALVQESAASRRFARITLVLFALSAAIVQLSRVGWVPRIDVQTLRSATVAEPAGRGWLHVAAHQQRRGTADGFPLRSLWWNLPQGVIACVTALVSGLLIGWLTLALLRVGGEWSLRSEFRGQRRHTAARQYGSAWLAPALAASPLLMLRPVCWALEVHGLTSKTPALAVLVIVGVIGALSVLMWWFWLMRVASTAPLPTRGRAVTFQMLGVPVVVGAVLYGWVVGQQVLSARWFAAWGLSWDAAR